MAMSTATLALLRLSIGAFMVASAAAMKVVLVPGPAAAAISVQALPLRVTAATSRAFVQMAGFGKATSSQVTTKKNKAGKKAPPLSAKRQWDRYSALLKDGYSPCDVFARDGSVDGDEWALVGSIAFDKAGSAQAAAACQKRLILEHAARMFPRLKLQKAALVCGVAGEDGAVVALEKVDVPAEMNCGFLGEPDAGGFYSKSNRVERATSASGAAPPTDSKGRIGG